MYQSSGFASCWVRDTSAPNCNLQFETLRPFLEPDHVACIVTLGQPPRPRKWARFREVAMFQMIDQTSTGPDDRKVLLYKVGMFIVAISAVGGVIFLCMRSLS